MNCLLQNVGRKFNREWIFRGISSTLESNNGYAVLGGNGSGKSTFMQVLAGNLLCSEGVITYKIKNETIDSEKIYKEVAFASPYLSLMEEYSLTEQLVFHAQLKPFYHQLTINEIIERLQLEKHRNKPLKYFSSGMKQRVKLALAIYSDVRMLLLDEPLSNLDASATNWYKKELIEFSSERIIIIASNHQEDEIFSCSERINISEYKNRK